MKANLLARLQRLERDFHPAECLDCPLFAYVTEDADGNLLEGAYPVPCRRCGHRPLVLVVCVPAERKRPARWEAPP
jgi:hypothetical protein